MNLSCIFGHKWDGCKCQKCGKIRDDDHQWNIHGKCSVCGIWPNRATLVWFDQVKTGMSSAEVISILGSPTSTMTDSEMINLMPAVISFGWGTHSFESWLYRRNGIKFVVHLDCFRRKGYDLEKQAISQMQDPSLITLREEWSRTVSNVEFLGIPKRLISKITAGN